MNIVITSKRSALLLAPVLLGLSLQSWLAAQTPVPRPPVIVVPLPITTTDEASMQRKVKVVGSTLSFTCPANGTWTDIPGASATFLVPAANKDLFVARFSAESTFLGSPNVGNIRILLNDFEMNPALGANYAFDSHDGGSQGEGHSLERSRSLTAGLVSLSAKVKVQCRTLAGTTFRIDDWHLTVEQLH